MRRRADKCREEEIMRGMKRKEEKAESEKTRISDTDVHISELVLETHFGLLNVPLCRLIVPTVKLCKLVLRKKGRGKKSE